VKAGTPFVIALLVAAAAPARAAPVLHYPPDELLVTGAGQLHVVGEADTMDVEVNGAAGAGTTVRRRAGEPPLAHAAVILAPGLNRLTIRFGGDTSAGSLVERRVFFAPRLAAHVDPPDGFTRQPFHAGTAARVCGGCHEVASRATDAAPATPGASTCFSCHRGLTTVPQVHGPAAQWACTRCHETRPGAASYTTPEPVMPLCVSCHVEQKQRLDTNAFQHGPTASGRCTICHDPHGSSQPFFLRKAPWELCTTCHAEKGSGRHVISWGPRGQGHPTRGRADPNRPGQELSCASCHNPHAAPAPRLWNFGATLWLELCRNCHRGLVGG
jgi:predicted CXXCH cytochrome family protein